MFILFLSYRRRYLSLIMLIFFSCYQLANMVEGRIQQTFDSDGNLFLDEDPKVVHIEEGLN